MNKYFQIRELAYAALESATKNGFNGAISAGGGSFNDLCGVLALRTGARFEVVKEIVSPIWDEVFEFTRLPGLDQYENWHVWEL